MAEELIPTVRRIYNAMARWDVETLSHSVTHDFELNLPDCVPFGGTRHGYDGVEAYATLFRDYIDGPWAEPDDFLDAGDALVVLGRLRGTGKRTGQAFEVPFAHVWTFNEGAPSRAAPTTTRPQLPPQSSPQAHSAGDRQAWRATPPRAGGGNGMSQPPACQASDCFGKTAV